MISSAVMNSPARTPGMTWPGGAVGGGPGSPPAACDPCPCESAVGWTAGCTNVTGWTVGWTVGVPICEASEETEGLVGRMIWWAAVGLGMFWAS
eukprot:12052402-Alexandrium_andersonii.AAC.1